MGKQTIITFILFAGVFFAACKKDTIQQEPQPYTLVVPAGFPQPIFNTDNSFTKEGIELGRMLFYDKRMSGNNQLSCGSCHKQDIGFTDGVAITNIGHSGNPLHRNTPALINMAWQNNGLFWDGGSTNLESQALAPMTSPDEMFQDLYELINELKAVPDYVNRFRFVYKDSIAVKYILKSLAQFQRTLISAGSRYDKYKRNEAGGNLNADELKGLQLVQQKCQGCHSGELFTDNNYHNNGMDDDFSNDTFDGVFQGRSRITFNPQDLGKFKTPTLRNVMLTAPYMHDGRFSTIEQVLNHYSSNVKTSATTDPLVVQNANGLAGIPLTQEDKNNITAFLKTLTDSSFITNKSFSDR